MDINIDLIKQIRETIDWIKDNFSKAKDKVEENNLNTIINDISILITHKQEYLFRLNEVKNSEEKLKEEIGKSLTIAAVDTEKLAADIKATRLNAGKLGLLLDSKLNTLTNIKLTEIEKFNSLLSGSTNNDLNKIIDTLSSYASKWLELGSDIEELKKNFK